MMCKVWRGTFDGGRLYSIESNEEYHKINSTPLMLNVQSSGCNAGITEDQLSLLKQFNSSKIAESKNQLAGLFRGFTMDISNSNIPEYQKRELSQMVDNFYNLGTAMIEKHDELLGSVAGQLK